jgi:hypothetical protein
MIAERNWAEPAALHLGEQVSATVHASASVKALVTRNSG